MSEKRLSFLLKQGLLVVALFGVMLFPSNKGIAQTSNRSAENTMTVRSDVQEANSETGVITARGNVQINYPAQEMQATAAQAQYYRSERRLVLTGDVYVLQGENSIRAEKVTYLLEEGRFVATPKAEQQVMSTYVIPQPQDTTEEENQPNLNTPPIN